MNKFSHPSRPMLMWAPLSAVIFFAVAWSLGKLLNIESLHEISKFSFYLAALAFLITNPIKPFSWAFSILAWLYHARPLSSLPKDERQALVWSLFIAEAVCVFTYILAVLLDSDGLRFVATVGFLVFSAVITILCLPICFRCLVRTMGWLSGGVWWPLVFLWRCYCWLNFRRIIFIAVGFCALVFLFYVEEDVRGWWAWQHFKNEWEAKGERFDYASIVPPPVPDDQNFALTPIVASCYEWGLTKDGKRITPFKTNVINRMRMQTLDDYRGPDWPWPTNSANWALGRQTDLKELQMYYRALATRTNEFPVPAIPQSPAVDVLLALSKYDSTIEELRKASALPYSRFPLNYEDMLHYSTNSPVVLLMHLASIKNCIPVLNLRAIAELENEQSSNALDDVKLALRLVNSTRVEPFTISHVLRAVEMKIVLQAVWEGMAKHKWTDTQLAAIEEELGKLDFLADSQLALRGDRNYSLVSLDYFRKQRPYNEFRQMFAPLIMMSPGPDDWPRIEREETIRAIIFCLIPSGWFYQEKVVVAKNYQQPSLQMTDPIKHLAFPEVEQNGQEYTGSLSPRPWNVFARWLGGGGEATTRELGYAQETTDLARIACSLERYRLANDSYPETLDVLAPQFIDKIPHDIIGGKPLHYRHTADGKYLLYSVGWNSVDDGGKIGLSTPNSDRIDLWVGDWVWPCDSSPIKAIYDRP
jgi:hypothetical protein